MEMTHTERVAQYTRWAKKEGRYAIAAIRRASVQNKQTAYNEARAYWFARNAYHWSTLREALAGIDEAR